MKYLRLLLFPFSILYNIVTSLRNYLYDTQLFSSKSFHLPLIVVGNLSVGGTGKTPQVEYMVRLLKEQFKIAVLSRGYKRETKGFLLLSESSTVQDAGDEPLQFYQKFSDITVAVDQNRVEGVQNLLKTENLDLIILDDAYQHRKIKASLYILLTSYNDLFTRDYILPAGNLRESRSGAFRADAIIVTKCPDDLTFDDQNQIRIALKKYHERVYFTTISYETHTRGAHSWSINDLKETEVLLITGIAKPEPLLQYLDSKDVHYTHLKFPDHHSFSKKDIAQIIKTQSKLGKNTILLTTEKDYTRLKPLIDISYIEIRTAFLDNQHIDFDRRLINHVKMFMD